MSNITDRTDANPFLFRRGGGAVDNNAPVATTGGFGRFGSAVFTAQSSNPTEPTNQRWPRASTPTGIREGTPTVSFGFRVADSSADRVPSPSPFTLSTPSRRDPFALVDPPPVPAISTEFKPLANIIYNEELFITKPDSNYECSICFNVMRDSCICTSCGNSFCHSCIQRCVQTRKKCSLCNCEMTVKSIVPNRSTRGVIENFQVRCFSSQVTGIPTTKSSNGVPPHSSGVLAGHSNSSSIRPSLVPSAANVAASAAGGGNALSSTLSEAVPDITVAKGCSWIGSLKDAGTHYDTECPYALVRCNYERCPNICHRQDLESHLAVCTFGKAACKWCSADHPMHSLAQHETLCDHRSVDCPNLCFTRVQFRLMTEHRNVCEQEMLSCRFTCMGCTTQLVRRDMKPHENDASFHMMMLFEELQKTRLRLRELESSHAQLQQELTQSQQNAEQIDSTNERVLQLENKTKAMEKKFREYDS